MKILFQLLTYVILLSFESISLAQLKGKEAHEVFGIIKLDSITFPKIVKSQRYSTVVLFVEKHNLDSDDTIDWLRQQYLGVADPTKQTEFGTVTTDEENDIILNSVYVDDVEYFYDSNNLLYNSHHNVIGQFDPITLSISIS